MAELLLKVGTVGPSPAYQDGDIIDAINDKRINIDALDKICDITKAGFTVNGLRPGGANSLPKFFYEKRCLYRFNRITRKQVRRTNLVTDAQDIIGDVPNTQGEYLFVEEYIKRRTRNRRHSIFGTPGREFWYTGDSKPNLTILGEVWDFIESITPNNRNNFTKWPFRPIEKRKMLILTVNDFTDLEARDLIIPEKTSDDIEGEILKVRKSFIDWRVLDLGVTEAQVDDTNQEIDIRDSRSFIRADVVETRNGRGR